MNLVRSTVPALLLAASALLSACATNDATPDSRTAVIISVRDQKMTVVKANGEREQFPVSTSKYGLGDRSRSYATPLGKMAIAGKIGAGAPAGAVFKGRVRTGEVVAVNSPGRDPIVTRILTLRGLESGNSQAGSRGIYIHGTPEEVNIGQPVSYGCIRMRSRDVIRLFDMVGVGSRVSILDAPTGQALALANVPAAPAAPAPAARPPSAEAMPAPATSVAASVAATSPTRPGSGPSVASSTWAGDPARMLASDPEAGRKLTARRGASSRRETLASEGR